MRYLVLDMALQPCHRCEDYWRSMGIIDICMDNLCSNTPYIASLVTLLLAKCRTDILFIPPFTTSIAIGIIIKHPTSIWVEGIPHQLSTMPNRLDLCQTRFSSAIYQLVLKTGGIVAGCIWGCFDGYIPDLCFQQLVYNIPCSFILNQRKIGGYRQSEVVWSAIYSMTVQQSGKTESKGLLRRMFVHNFFCQTNRDRVEVCT